MLVIPFDNQRKASALVPRQPHEIRWEEAGQDGGQAPEMRDFDSLAKPARNFPPREALFVLEIPGSLCAALLVHARLLAPPDACSPIEGAALVHEERNARQRQGAKCGCHLSRR